jgi:hypothetical protein
MIMPLIKGYFPYTTFLAHSLQRVRFSPGGHARLDRRAALRFPLPDARVALSAGQHPGVPVPVAA